MDNEELEELQSELEDLQSELTELQSELNEEDGFDRDNYYTSFDEALDDGADEISIVGITFEPSEILKECDPTAYSCYFNDYVSTYEDEHNEKISDMEQVISDKKEEITEKENEIANI